MTPDDLLKKRLTGASASSESGGGGLDLSQMKLSELPRELFLLTNLDTLYLNDNDLRTLPPEIGNLVNLRTLDLSHNHLTTLPAEIGDLRKLRSLKLTGNQLNALPPEIGNLANLETIEAGHDFDAVQSAYSPFDDFYTPFYDGKRNQLTELPAEIGNLANLEVLNLAHNKLTDVPRTIGNLASLKVLQLDHNELLTLRSAIGNLSSLKVLNLEKNKLIRLPSELGQLTNLETIHLQSNQLTRVPSEIGQLTQLTHLDLTNNQLKTLPSEIGQLTNLKSLSLGYNQLTALPPEIGQLKSLRSLHLKNNQLTALPPEIGNLANLESLSLIDNQLTGLPDTIAHLKNLKALFLQSDQRLPLLATRLREWDVFISHASEDSETVALPLASALIKAGIKVWIDKQDLQLGDSIRTKIDLGLSKSRFGIVILSQSFIDKTWTQRELNGLLALEDQGEKVILPVWHNISKEMLTQFSPMLSDRLAANTAEGISAIASKIIDVVLYQANSSPSTLLPNLTRRFVELIRKPDSTPTTVRDFLVQHERILHQAFGQWEGKLTRVSAGSFNQYPAVLGTYEITATAKIIYSLCLIFTSPHASLVSDSQIDRRDSLIPELLKIRREEEFRLRTKAGELTRTVIASGRRQELSELEMELIGELNGRGRALHISLRTYDFLIDACVAIDQSDWKR